MPRGSCFRPLPRRKVAGFTLVELMVAMTGGLFLTIVLYALSRDAAYVYQRETRLANATLAGVAGFERLSNDVARAGHMSTPNIAADPRVCNRPQASWPDGIERLRAVAINTGGGSVAGTEVADAGITPHSITISGALEAPEELYTNSIEPVANGFLVSINRETPSALRLGLSTDAGAIAANLAVLQSVFTADGGNVGRIVRLRKDGSEQYGVVSAVASTATTATLTLAGTAPLQFRSNSPSSTQCGINDNGTGYSLSVINIVRYEIRKMSDVAKYASLFAASAGPESEAKRAELVRVEIGPDNQPINGTDEIVAEYAVDLRFTPWAANGPTDPTMSTTATAADYTDQAGAPQLLRGLGVRLVVRSREADRQVGIGTGGGSAAYRVPVAGGFARTRTFQSDVALRNLEGAYW